LTFTQHLLLALFLAPARKMTSFFAGTSPQTPVVKIYEIIWLTPNKQKTPT